MTEFVGDIVRKEYEGMYYRLADNWFPVINPDTFKERPINYLEIGTFCGGNLISVADSYAHHKDSKLYCIDPWENYGDYNEYQESDRQKNNYEFFLSNVNKTKHRNKINIKRGYSNNEILNLPDDYFDMIYVDGNHESEYVLEDAVLSFRKLKEGGYMIFDDYGWGSMDDFSTVGIECFLRAYKKRVEVLGIRNTQVFVKKVAKK
jgi:predicted O-methyltransferase YrrM